MNKSLITLALTFISMSATAGWTEFSGSSNDGSVKTYYDRVNTRQYTHSKDQVIRVWQTKDFAKKQTTDNKTYLSVKSLIEVNCQSKMQRTLAYSQYSQNMGRGESVFKDSTPDEWKNIAPDVTSEAMRRFYCGKE